MSAILSLQQFMAIRDESHRHELSEGKLIVTDIPFSEHTIVANNICELLPRRDKHGFSLIGAGYLLTPDPRATVRAPDVSFISRSRVESTPDDAYVQGAPELAVEVVCHGDDAAELEAKIVQYIMYGSQEVWVVYPRTRSIYVHKAGGIVKLSDVDTLTTDLFPGWSTRVAEFFNLGY